MYGMDHQHVKEISGSASLRHGGRAAAWLSTLSAFAKHPVGTIKSSRSEAPRSTGVVKKCGRPARRVRPVSVLSSVSATGTDLRPLVVVVHRESCTTIANGGPLRVRLTRAGPQWSGTRSQPTNWIRARRAFPKNVLRALFGSTTKGLPNESHHVKECPHSPGTNFAPEEVLLILLKTAFVQFA
jgi:hypothetical protein